MKKVVLALVLVLFCSQANAKSVLGFPNVLGGVDANELEVTPTGSSTSDSLADLLSPSSILNYTGTGGTIVILGSSTAAGVGSSNYTGDPNNEAHPISTTSWVGIVCAQLTQYTCKNQSISGTHTASSIARFKTDVVKHKPRYVILATAIWNEPNFSTSPVSVGKTYLQNTKKLAKMIQDIGAIPVIHGPYPKSSANATSYAVMKGVYSELEKDFPIIFDFLGTVDDGTGAWFSGLSGDGTHPNNAGHAALANTVSIAKFSGVSPYILDFASMSGKWKMPSVDTTASPLGVTTRALSSFTMRGKYTFTTDINGRAFLSADAGSGNVLRVRNLSEVYDLVDGSTQITTSSERGDDFKEHDLVMTFNATQNTTKLYIDGILIGSGALNQTTSKTRFSWAGHTALTAYSALNAVLSDCSLWSTELSADDISSMFNGGRLPTKSLEVHVPLNHVPNVGFALNAAGTNYIVTSPSAWSKVNNTLTVPNGSVATSLTSVGPTGSNTTVQEWMQIKNSSGATRYIPMF